MKYVSLLMLLLTSGLFLQCSKGGEGNGPQAGPATEQQLRQEAGDQFSFTPNRPFGALYRCGRVGSGLEWFFLFHPDNSLQVLFTTDTWEDYVFDGTYRYESDELRLMMPAGPAMPFPQGLDERSTLIMPQFGLLAAFATPEMVCVCIGHDLNEQDPPKVQANYDCPNINFQAVSDEDNAIEFMLTHVPFAFPVPGSIFRQQDTYVQGLTDPIIRRGTGIYRQVGDRFYANFRLAADFAAFAEGQLPLPIPADPPFEDYNLLSGRFLSGGQEIVVDQLDPSAGACSLR